MDSRVHYQDDGIEIPVKVRPPQKDWRDIFSEDRFWAATAHALGPVMIMAALIFDHCAWLGIICITAGIYVYFSDKSTLVKQHARQALAMQLIGTFGWLILLLSGTAIWVVMLIMSLLLIIAVIGIFLTPLVIVAYPIFALATLLLPLSVAVFGAIGAYEVWHGKTFHYPYLTKYLDKYFGRITSEIVIV